MPEIPKNIMSLLVKILFGHPVITKEDIIEFMEEKKQEIQEEMLDEALKTLKPYLKISTNEYGDLTYHLPDNNISIVKKLYP